MSTLLAPSRTAPAAPTTVVAPVTAAAPAAPTVAVQDAAPSEHRVLVFKIGQESYAVDILQVCEIRSYAVPNRISNAASDLLGVINLRGTVVPVFDLRLRLGIGSPCYDEQTAVIVVERAGQRVGTVVDSVSDVLDLTHERLQPVPELPGSPVAGQLLGIATVADQMLLLVDIASLVGPAADRAVDALH